YRQAWKVEHKLSDILLLTICAVISGAEGWEDIEDFGETHLDFLKQYGDFENGIPVHAPLARVFSPFPLPSLSFFFLPPSPFLFPPFPL
ncbi:transposase family protein, partial [Klebsiella pneumoniae]|nr:transposase family protein [Klebsiella pneumoniae]